MVLARLGQAQAGNIAVAVHVTAELLEARVTLAGPLRRGGIHGREIAEHRFDGGVKAIEIEPVEADARRGGPCAVEPAQPAEKRHDDVVAPHPAWEARKAVQRPGRVHLVRLETHPSTGTGRIRPVRFDGHDIEPVLLEEGRREIGPNLVELGGPVRGLADQHDAGVADRLDERLDDRGFVIAGSRRRPNCVNGRVVSHGCPDRSSRCKQGAVYALEVAGFSMAATRAGSDWNCSR